MIDRPSRGVGDIEDVVARTHSAPASAAATVAPASHTRHMLEPMPAEQQRWIAQQLVEKFSAPAPAWQVHAGLLEDASERLAATERVLAARPDPDTRGSLLVDLR